VSEKVYVLKGVMNMEVTILAVVLFLMFLFSVPVLDRFFGNLERETYLRYREMLQEADDAWRAAHPDAP